MVQLAVLALMVFLGPRTEWWFMVSLVVSGVVLVLAMRFVNPLPRRWRPKP